MLKRIDPRRGTVVLPKELRQACSGLSAGSGYQATARFLADHRRPSRGERERSPEPCAS